MSFDLLVRYNGDKLVFLQEQTSTSVIYNNNTIATFPSLAKATLECNDKIMNTDL